MLEDLGQRLALLRVWYCVHDIGLSLSDRRLGVWKDMYSAGLYVVRAPEC